MNLESNQRGETLGKSVDASGFFLCTKGERILGSQNDGEDEGREWYRRALRHAWHIVGVEKNVVN